MARISFIIIQHIVTLPGHNALTDSSSVVNRYPAIYVISCVGEKNGKIKILSSSSVLFNVLSDKKLILLSLVEYPLILANWAYGLVG